MCGVGQARSIKRRRGRITKVPQQGVVSCGLFGGELGGIAKANIFVSKRQGIEVALDKRREAKLGGIAAQKNRIGLITASRSRYVRV